MKLIILALIAAVFVMFAHNFVTSHVQKIENPNFVTCSVNRCFMISETTYIIK